MLGKEDLTAHLTPYQNNMRRMMISPNKKRFYADNLHHKQNALIIGSGVSPPKEK